MRDLFPFRSLWLIVIVILIIAMGSASWAQARVLPSRPAGLAAWPGELPQWRAEDSAFGIASWTWAIERVDAPRLLGRVQDRSLALDSAGHPHLAYGSDFLYYRWYDGVEWHLETVDDSGGVGVFVSLALDSAGRPHIGYMGPDGGPRYAYHDGSTWRIQTVGAAGDLVCYTSLAVDDAGQPHLAYYEWISGELRYAHQDGPGWQIQAVDQVGRVSDLSLQISLAVDGDGHPHIAYYDRVSADLKYADFDGSAWQIQVLDSTGDVGHYASLALDGNGQPHISYCFSQYGDGACSTLKYATHGPGGWQLETIDGPDMQEGYTSIAVGPDGHPGIGYGSAGFRYAHFDGVAWQIEEVGGAGHDGISLAIDQAGRPRVAVYAVEGQLEYAYRGEVGWEIEVLDRSIMTGAYTSLVLDGAGRPHISYYNSSLSALQYAYYDGTAWLTETVDQDPAWRYLGRCSSLDLDSAGRPHISYDGYYNEHGYLKYAYNDGSSWQVQVVDDVWSVSDGSLKLDAADRPHVSYHDGSIGRYAWYDGTAWHYEEAGMGGSRSLALDATGRPHIASYNATSWDLQYSYYDGAQWLAETVDSAGNVGEQPSLALDSSGRPHISYVDITNGDIKYAWHDGTVWQFEVVDDDIANHGYIDGYNTSLALDALDRPHISYYDNLRNCLKYARYDGTAWQKEVVDSVDSGDAGRYSSLQLDAVGQPRISYLDGTNRDLKYARAFCEPPGTVSISGRTLLLVGEESPYTATYTPITASLPLTLTWDNGTMGSRALYIWSEAGVYTLSVTGTNACGWASGSLVVQVGAVPPYRVYLPIVIQNEPQSQR